MSTPENPPAFPRDCANFEHKQEGMTLRDYFAGQALAGFCALQEDDGDALLGAFDAARAAYNYANAMLAERSK